MPWSEWITSPPYARSTRNRYRVRTQSGATSFIDADLPSVYEDGRAGLYATDVTTEIDGSDIGGTVQATRSEAANQLLGSTDWGGGIVQNQVLSIYTPELVGLPDWRAWFPDELDNLTEGVDYTVRPDRTGTESDSYVEYEEGDAEFVGWQGSIAATLTNFTSSLEPPLHGTARWRVISPAPPLPALPGPSETVASPAPVVYAADAGVDAGAIINGVQGQSLFADFSAALEGVGETFAVLTTTDDHGDPVTSGTGAFYQKSWQVQGGPSVRVLVQLPRWRYWIPDAAGILPLRQFPRDDGLRGTGRALGLRSSRQGSLSQTAYI